MDSEIEEDDIALEDAEIPLTEARPRQENNISPRSSCRTREFKMIPKSKSVRSRLWNYFWIYLTDDPYVSKLVVCRLCYEANKDDPAANPASWEIYRSDSTSTIYLKRHIKKFHPKLCEECCQSSGIEHAEKLDEKEEPLKRNNGAPSERPSNGDKQAPKDQTLAAIINFISSQFLPIDIVEDPSFQALLAMIHSDLSSLGSELIREEMNRQLVATSRTMSLIANVQHLSLSLDCWTGATMSYGLLSAHWIDAQWQQRSAPLDCFPLPPGPDALKHTILDLLSKHKVSFDGIEAIVLHSGDMAATLDLPVDSLACFANQIHGVVQSLTKALDLMPMGVDSIPIRFDTVKKVSRICKHLHSLPADEELVSPSCWWTIGNLMMQAWQHLSVPSSNTHVGRGGEAVERLDAEELAYVELVATTLAPFASVQKCFDAESSPFISVLPLIIRKLYHEVAKLSSSSNESVRKIGEILLQELVGRWGEFKEGHVFVWDNSRTKKRKRVGMPRAWLIAHFLDPRFKSLDKIPGKDAEALMKAVEHLAVEMHALDAPAASSLKSVATLSEKDTHSRTSTGPSSAKKRPAEFSLDAWLEDSDHEASQQPSGRYTLDVGQLVKVQIASYLQQPRLSMDGDPLLWWKSHGQHFPMLAKLACRVLGTPVSSLPLNMLFSQKGIALLDRRAKIAPDIVQGMVILHYRSEFHD